MTATPLKRSEEIAGFCAEERIRSAENIRVRGTVQGVGFRPTVYRLARHFGLTGDVCNDGEGVFIRVKGDRPSIDSFVHALHVECPPLARIESLIRQPIPLDIPLPAEFTITQSIQNTVQTNITPDAATCSQCRSEIFDPLTRWYRYPFTNCTHCGPRLSIVRAIPYDRQNTSMSVFQMCSQCRKEYEDVGDRRFHAQPVACHVCGPKTWLERADGRAIVSGLFSMVDDVDAVCTLLQRGEIVAIKGIGGVHLACDATNEAAVHQLRQRKQRYHKPFALMARDLAVIEQYCEVSQEERSLLESSAAPIVLLRRKVSSAQAVSSSPPTTLRSRIAPSPVPELAEGFSISCSPQNDAIAPSVAPDVSALGFMLPYTPLHHLMLRRINRPIVMTSGNLSDEPQCITNEAVRHQLGGIADYFLLHNREIVNRVDDSVVRVVTNSPENAPSANQVQILRRARGYAPAPIALPTGFEAAPPILAMGSELKNTFCLLRDGRAILSQHLGDLENAIAFEAYQETLNLYLNLFEHQPGAIAIDLHPEYLSSKLGKELAAVAGVPLYHVQHHHAHIAACMAENGLPLRAQPVLGIALDGLGYGADGGLWGGEFLLADYRSFQRLAQMKPVAMLGGEQAVYQPWRNTYAHLSSAFNWADLMLEFGHLELLQFLDQKPRTLLDQMRQKGINSPRASSAGRLFDAVAAAVNLCRESCSDEGQGAIALEALAEQFLLSEGQPDQIYPFELGNSEEGLILNPAPMWRSLLADLRREEDRGAIAARFHLGLSEALVQVVLRLQEQYEFTQVALTGGVFQNQLLHQQICQRLCVAHLNVLVHGNVPPNDGGLSLGQGAIAAAQLLNFSP